MNCDYNVGRCVILNQTAILNVCRMCKKSGFEHSSRFCSWLFVIKRLKLKLYFMYFTRGVIVQNYASYTFYTTNYVFTADARHQFPFYWSTEPSNQASNFLYTSTTSFIFNFEFLLSFNLLFSGLVL